MGSLFQSAGFNDNDAHELGALRARIISAKLDISYMRLAMLLRKAGFDPNQPRVSAGNADGGQWSPTAIGGARRALAAERARERARGRGRGVGQGGTRTPDRIRVAQASRRVPVAVRVDIGNGKRRFMIATPGQATRLTHAQVLRNSRVKQVQQINPGWQPRPRQAHTIEQAISRLNRDIRDADARLRQLARPVGIGHNQPLGGRPRPRGVPQGDTRPSFHATTPPPPTPREMLATRRIVIDMSTLPTGEAKTKYDGTVAVAEVNDKLFFGENSKSGAFVQEDNIAAFAMRDVLVRKYPDVMNTENVGQIPNDAVFHAEATLLLRAARANGGNLKGQRIEITTDRRLCSSCQAVLPALSRELGLDTLTIHAPRGVTHTLRNGRWDIERSKP